ncbi:MAG: hypothetical protein ACOYLO_00085 [Ferruginibacter sp.]
MKEIIDKEDFIIEGNCGLATLLGTMVYCACTSYAYTGKLVGVSNRFIEIENPSIVFLTGAWGNKDWKDVQRLPAKKIVIFKAQIESLFTVSR